MRGQQQRHKMQMLIGECWRTLVLAQSHSHYEPRIYLRDLITEKRCDAIRALAQTRPDEALCYADLLAAASKHNATETAPDKDTQQDQNAASNRYDKDKCILS